MDDPRGYISEYNPNALFVDGHDNAIIGIGIRCGQPPLAVYDNAIVRKNLMKSGMDETDAIEYCEFNIFGAWLGENTPIFLERFIDVGREK